jgi:hypothetical protein
VIRVIVGLTLLLSVVVSASAAEIDIVGAGARTCAEFIKVSQEYPKEAEYRYFGWAQGLISGLNFDEIVVSGKSHNLNSIAFDEQQRIIREYCKKHPLDRYMDAVLNLYGRFSRGTLPK